MVKYLLIFSLFSFFVEAQPNVYFFPGQGTDERIFEKIILPDSFNVHHIQYAVPSKKDNMHSYAMSMIRQIDTTERPIYFIGQSLGGMISTELIDILNPDKVIIISSAKTKNELPVRYTWQKRFPIHQIIPKMVIKVGASMLQPIFEPDRNNRKETFKAMLSAKKPLYLKRTINLIVNWDRNNYTGHIIHIHGTNDHTIPSRNVDADFLIEGGSHMMVLTRGEEIAKLILLILSKPH